MTEELDDAEIDAIYDEAEDAAIHCVHIAAARNPYPPGTASDGRPMRRHPLEADVVLRDGSVVRVTGLLAARYRTDPEGVREWLEKHRAEIAIKKAAAESPEPVPGQPASG